MYRLSEPKSSAWILLPVLFSLILSAWVGLQLFQDGGSYLLEILITQSAVRHERWSALLFQAPTVLLIKIFYRLGIDSLTTLPMIRLAFSLNYALTPFVSLFLSWLVVRKKREELFVWVALIILLVNLVNFSWVSELLISVQLACPVLLALLQNPRSKTFWILVIVFTPFLFFLHPLVITIYLILGAASAYIARQQPHVRSAASLSLILFLLAAISRAIFSLFNLSSYEVSFAAAGETTEYFVVNRLENILFLVTAVEVAFLVLLSRSISQSSRRFVNVLTILIICQTFLQSVLAVNFLLPGKLLFPVVIVCFGLAAYLATRRVLGHASMDVLQLSYLSCGLLAGSAAFLLIAQYASTERLFTLKMGLDLFVALLIMSMAVFDSAREITSNERVLRFRLAVVLSAMFALAITAKSAMWYTSVHRLEKTLSTTNEPCVEISSADFRWLQDSPYMIINNWSLPSLALVIQDERPRKALLAQDDCDVFLESGMIQVDPWSIFSKEFLVPPLGLSSKSYRH